jgi:pimeloyl-ACP methyl ester carboxylesterase
MSLAKRGEMVWLRIAKYQFERERHGEGQLGLQRSRWRPEGDRATVLGHSWGSSVAVALALKYPDFVSALILASGYFYPTARADGRR